VALDEAALLAAYRRLRQPLHNVLYRWLWHAPDCEDVMHDAILRVWDRRATVDASKVDALLYATALNLAKNRLRWRGLWRFVAPERDAAGDEDPALDAEAHLAQRRVRAALERLDDTARNVLLLSEFAGLDTAQLAEVLGVAAGTVGSRRHRALAALRRELGDGHGT
jgi:RNA polymerase sigma-70 factor (ECF subfamily)